MWNEETEAQRRKGPCPRSHSYRVAKPGLELGQQLSLFFKLLSQGEGAFPAPPNPCCLSPNATPVLLWFQLFPSAYPQNGSSLRAALVPAAFWGPLSPHVAHPTGGTRVVLAHRFLCPACGSGLMPSAFSCLVLFKRHHSPGKWKCLLAPFYR